MMKIMMKIMMMITMKTMIKIMIMIEINANKKNHNFQVQSFKIQERRPDGGEKGGAYQVGCFSIALLCLLCLSITKKNPNANKLSWAIIKWVVTVLLNVNSRKIYQNIAKYRNT